MPYDAAVEVGIAVALAHPQASDRDLVEALLATGVEPGLAERLALWLPLAFGRVLLDGVTIPASPLDEDPVFVAASRRARRANRAEVERLGLRSAEVLAVNAALCDGAQLNDLVLSPPAHGPLPPLDGGVPSPESAFAGFVEAHGHAVVREEDGYRAGDLRFGARVFPRVSGAGARAQVDFWVAHPALAAPVLLESYAGAGQSWRDALGQAVRKFERGSVHVLLDALVRRGDCADQVTWERWENPTGPFDACMGGILTLYGEDRPWAPGPLIDALMGAAATQPWARQVHALRVYVARAPASQGIDEVLLDNEPWEEGLAVVRAHPFPEGTQLWGWRWFVMFVPTEARAG